MTLASASADASPSTVKTTVRQYIQDNFLMGTAEAYADDASFMDAQLLDSTGFLELVQFLEETYGIKVEDEEMMPDNLDSLDAVARFVSRKQAA
ncbi:acyl carrier protein [Pseudoxanthomonas sp. SL93]|jgi:acyl carrier protein|uniref:acyl carrier protein n=1 Tax=Pseudoxanthomonas sp. SL93 TaxID=2995142 RepID=UPI00226E10F1|nr:acyl carrier protein [Pseudoxanthomonas sp. SL93]WAC64097.1 acyl carrier protein [Pseudoxanthomonas sp. SL93]